MTGDPDENEMARVLALPFPARYEYFLEQVAATQTLWSLADEEGWALLGDDYGGEEVPVWSHPLFAAACALDCWGGTTPRAIPLDDWFEKWAPGMLADQRRVAVFPTPEGKAISVGLEELERNLDEQISGPATGLAEQLGGNGGPA